MANSDIVARLNQLQADYQVLYQKLRHYHWNVTGPQFFELHAQFETLYNEAATFIDDLAERTLALGGRPPSTLAVQLKHARLKEDDSLPNAETMGRNLHEDFVTLNRAVREASVAADEAGDPATVNLLDDIAVAQEKTIWMLRAFSGAGEARPVRAA